MEKHTAEEIRDTYGVVLNQSNESPDRHRDVAEGLNYRIIKQKVTLTIDYTQGRRKHSSALGKIHFQRPHSLWRHPAQSTAARSV